MRTVSLAKLILLLFVIFACPTPSLLKADVIDFEDTGSITYYMTLPSPYHGMTWTNFNVVDSNFLAGFDGGYNRGVKSPHHAGATLGAGSVSSVSSLTSFDFISSWVTPSYNDGETSVIQGYRGGTLVYSDTRVVNAASPQFITFNFFNIDTLTFTSSGGIRSTITTYGGDNDNLVLDDMTFRSSGVVPEPAGFVILSLGVVGLGTYRSVRRRISC